MSTSDGPGQGRVAAWGRAPAVPVAVAVIIGILADRLTELNAPFWIGGAVVALVSGLIAERFRRQHAATITLLLVCCCLGGLRHHLRWSTIGPHDVSRHAVHKAVPVQLVGVIDSPISIEAADHSQLTPPWMQVDRSHCDLQCERLVGLWSDRPATGRVRVIATGHVLHASVGDRVEVTGQIIQPRGPPNPGGFDYRDYLRRQGIRCLLVVAHPDAIRRVDRDTTLSLSRLRARLRDECEDILVQHLDRQSVPLAMSLLLGERSQLPQETRDAFAESGTVHLLAISGLHVGILAVLLLFLCRLAGASVPVTTVVLIGGIVAYAFVTNHRPPVIRASILAVTVAAGWPWFRRASGANLIAICALIVLLINPTDLFDVGTQLSFLAVVAIGRALALLHNWRMNPWRPSWTDLLWEPHAGLLGRGLRWLVEGYVITVSIWLFTTPLVAARFHLVAPVGFLLNVVLLPFVGVVLWLGFVTLFCGLLIPWIVRWPAALFDWSLQGLQSIVDAAAAVRLGHASVAGPEEWWLAGFYLLLATALVIRWGRPLRKWAWRGVCLWGILGLIVPLVPNHREGLRCTFLSVGHGCAVVVELPGGETLLYDAGMFGSARRGQSRIENSLWEKRVTGIDAIVVSHADIDHFNAAAGLMENMPVGTLFIHQTFLDFTQEPVGQVCESASREGVPIRILQSGDQLQVGDGEAEISVIHPSPGWRSEEDNANSLVLKIVYAGRTILLTGDVEHDGLERLIASPTEPIDVMLSPHHGSRDANPIELAEWASPRFVIISGGERTSGPELRHVYADAERVLSTHNAGAVSVSISSEGELTVEEWSATK